MHKILGGFNESANPLFQIIQMHGHLSDFGAIGKLDHPLLLTETDVPEHARPE